MNAQGVPTPPLGGPRGRATARTGEGRESPPEPSGLTGLDDLAARLVELREWAGTPSYSRIARRVADLRTSRGLPAGEATPGRVTVYDCFRPGRARIDPELLADIVAALGAEDRVPAWRLAHAELERGRISADVVQLESPPAPAAAHFVGRDRELAWLTGADAARVTVLVGMPGVGKSQLARRVAERWVAGGLARVLWVDLHGYGEDQPPAAPHTVLGALLRQLGVPGPELLRLDLEGRVARTRELVGSDPAPTTGVVLDNARGPAQTGPLLRALAGARVLLTSRASYPRPTGTDHHDWSQLEVSPMPMADSLALLRALAPGAPLDAEPDQGRRLVDLCGGLPLQLAITGSRLAETPAWSLADQVRRLEAVDAVDSVRRALASSYAGLPEETAWVLRAIALHPGETVSLWAGAALAGVGVEQVEAHLELLRAEHLVRTDPHGRVRLHDLVRRYAWDLGRDVDPHSTQVDAGLRLLRHYRTAAGLACHRLRTTEEPAPPPAGIPIPPLDDLARAREWLTLETPNLLAATLRAGERGYVDELAGIAEAVAPWLEADGALAEATRLHEAARRAHDRDLRAAAATNLARIHDVAGDAQTALGWAEIAVAEAQGRREAAALLGLGSVQLRMARLAAGHRTLTRAVEAARHEGSRMLEGRALEALALATQFLGRFEEALQLFRDAAVVSEEVGDQVNLAVVDADAAYLFILSERWEDAERVLRRSLRLLDELGLRTRTPFTLAALGEVLSRQGDHEAGLVLVHEGIDRARELDLDTHLGACWVRRAEIEARVGRLEDATSSYARGLEVADRWNATWIRTDALNGLGEVALLRGDHAEARSRFGHGLELAMAMGDPFETARAHRGLGDCSFAQGEPRAAAEAWERARQSYASLGNPQAERLASRIAEARRLASARG
ncbi:MAG: hypothetical protein U0R80_17035 [Nocardioidaceae bacterium]